MRKASFFGGQLAVVAAVLVGLPGEISAQAQAQGPAETQAPAQVRGVISKEVSVARSEASLRLELQGGERFEASLRDGVAFVDGRELGSFEPGGPLDSAWRALLGQAIALENGPLAVALREWSPPEGLSAEAAEAARELDTALEDALAARDGADPVPDPRVEIGDDAALARLLTGSLARLSVIEEALEGVDRDLRLHIDEDFELNAGEVVRGTVVVIEGDAVLGGEIEGDLVVIDGTVELLEGSRISGELRTADARIIRNLGAVDGGIVDVLEDERSETAVIRSQIREEVRDELRRELRRELRDNGRAVRDGFSLLSPIRSILRGIGGLIQNVILVFVLGLIGAATISFAGRNLEVVADAARRSPGRSAMVGVAGMFLLVPAWVLGAVALVVSIVGIPVALAWLPLFPIAAALAALLGYLAVARNIGEWLADSGYAWTEWVRKSNPVHTMVAGLVGLTLAFMAADVVSMAPFLGFLSGLLTFIGIMLTVVVTLIGFGAVLLTRAGRRPEDWTRMDPDAAWAAAMDFDETAEAGTGAGTAGDRKEEEPHV